MPTVTVAEKPKRRPYGEVLGHADKYGSGSPRGSSYYSALLKCMREYALSSVLGLRPERDDEALTTGSLYHHGLEVYRRHIMAVQHQRGIDWCRTQPGAIDETTRQAAEDAAYAALQPFAEEPGYDEVHSVLLRMLRSYFAVTKHKRYFVLSCEEELIVMHPFEYSARLDLVCIELGTTAEQDVLRAIEYKSARAIADSLISGYQLHLQTLGQAWLMVRCVDLTKYPRFVGVLVDITSKAKDTKHIEVPVVPTREGLQAFERAVTSYQRLRVWAEQEKYPPNFTACAGANRSFRHCQFYNLCFTNPNLDVATLAAQQDPPSGFVRVTHADTDEYED